LNRFNSIKARYRPDPKNKPDVSSAEFWNGRHVVCS